VCHVLELTLVVGDGEVALDKVLKGGVEVEGALFMIEMNWCSRASQTARAVCPDDLLEVAEDVAVEYVEPRQDNTVHACSV